MPRKNNIDLLRILSAFAVILIHIISAPLSNASGVVSPVLKHSLECIHILMLWSVPVFFMITGYCLALKRTCTYQYCFSHVYKYIGVLFTVGLFYALLEEVFTSHSLSVSVVIKSVYNVITGNLWDHMWFVYSVIGIYLVMPVIHSFIWQHPTDAATLAGLLFLFTILFPSIENLLPIGIHFPFGGNLFYVIFGGLFARNPPGKKTLQLFILLGVFAAVSSFLYDLSELNYRHPVVCFMAAAIFLAFQSLNIPAASFVREVSSCTWGIYLIHPFFINLVLKLFRIDLLSSFPYLKLTLFAFFITFISLASTKMLRSIPVIKKLF